MADRINLREFEAPSKDVHVIEAESRARAVQWGFVVLAATIAVGVLAFAIITAGRLDSNPLREWLQTTISGEIGLLAGLLGAPASRRSE